MIKEQQISMMNTTNKKRSHSKLITAQYKELSKAQAARGQRSDTKELNINLKTLTCAFLKNLQITNELDLYEIKLKNNYKQLPPSFQSILYLFFGEGYESQREKPITKKIDHFLVDQKDDHKSYSEARKSIHRNCSSYFRSTSFIKDFMRSTRMHFKNKMILLKFLNKIEQIMSQRSRAKPLFWKKQNYT